MTMNTEDLLAKITTAPGRYDLPLPKSMGSGFLVLLVALMTCLSVFALAGSLTLSGLSKKWSSGLQSALTIELPAQPDGQTQKIAELIAASLRGLKSVSHVSVLQNAEMAELLSPWMGKDSRILDTAPLPGILSLELHDTSDATIKEIEALTHQYSPQATLDRHQDWLSHVLRLAGILKFASFLVVIVIALTTVTAVAGAVRAQMAAFHDQIEILHLMGATDRYISTQFARHAIVLALRGALTGFCFSALCLASLQLSGSLSSTPLLPDNHLDFSDWAFLFSMPFMACLIVMLTAFITVQRTLRRLP